MSKLFMFLGVYFLSVNFLQGQVNDYFTQAYHSVKIYKANNKETYRIGDFIELNQSVGNYKNQQYYEALYLGSDIFLIRNKEHNHKVEIPEEITKYKVIEIIVVAPHTVEQSCYLIIMGKNLVRYILDIEKAIQFCEIQPCLQENSNKGVSITKYDKLRELKKLLDEGIINKQEFESEKEKVMSGN